MMKNQAVSAPEPLPAATVILAREHQSELQVYLLKRHAQSGFMAGRYVFPGGILNPVDWEFTLWQNHVDFNAQDRLRRLGGGSLTAEQIMAYGVAAIRETLEEAGVFLATRSNQDGADLKRIAALRCRPQLPQNWFLDLITSEGWTLALSALYRWSHWITPRLMKRRYDTRFFLALMPSGQNCQPDRRETTHGLWISPPKGLAANMAGQVPLAPPTMVTLQELLKYPTLAALKRTAQTRAWGLANVPRLIRLEKGAVLLEPWDPDYHQPDLDIDADQLAKGRLPAGEPFSRLWDCDGIWRPITK